MRFKPYIGLTLITAVFLGILLTLGTWQYNRLAWKTQLLIDVEAASQAAPFTSLSELERAFEAKQPIDYRRINISAAYVPLNRDVDQPYVSGEFHVLRVQDKTTGWRIFRPAAQNSRIVFTAGQWVSDDLKTAQRMMPEGEQYITGYVRSFEKPSRFAAKSSPDLNRWMSFNADPNVMDWASLLAGKDAQTGYYIDAIHSAADPYTGALPPRVPDIPNNHFDYMLTWYSFALILLVIYLLLHIRGNRLTLRRK